jgi:hypothetical protein
MFEQLLPSRIDNTYRGYTVALWLFGLVLFVKAGMGGNSIINSYHVASVADGIPLQTFPPAAVQIVVYMFASWGLAHVLLALLGVLALVRYRAMVPLLFVVILLEQAGRRALHLFRPVPTVGTPRGVYVNLLLWTLMIAGVALSFRYGRREAA